MQKADKMWIAAAVVVPLVLRDRRQRHKIKDLKKLVELLNLENEFLHAFVNGVTDPKIDKKALIDDLAHKFQFITMVKDI